MSISHAWTHFAAIQTQADMTDIRRQLSTLLGREVKQLRTTDETPPRISVIDVAVVITGHGADYASQTIRGIWQKHPEVREKITDFKFPGKRQRKNASGKPAHLRIEVNEKITDFELRGPSQRHPTPPSHREFAQQLSGCAAQVISTYKRQFRSGCRGRGWGMEWERDGGVTFLAPFQPCKYT